MGNGIATFKDKQKATSQKIVRSTDKQIIEKCQAVMTRVKPGATFEAKSLVESWAGIEQSKFEEVITNLGKRLQLPEDDVDGMKLKGSGSFGGSECFQFKCSMKIDGGYVRLHTGSYQVTAIGEGDDKKITLELAIAYMDITEVVFEEIPEAKPEAIGWFDKDKPEAPPAVNEWSPFFDYHAHNSLLKAVE
eukprot:TRINITY_DN32815_c0_g1_i1.p1 TRINITY_DN32815_c0_g1~~TRINITY_DN32815_c0_g1_i1.p1  ORF type:complete len:191 (-),score=63.18 TRINITY_DN32815_c0_g1_i1:27-599(-)